MESCSLAVGCKFGTSLENVSIINLYWNFKNPVMQEELFRRCNNKTYLTDNEKDTLLTASAKL